MPEIIKQAKAVSPTSLLKGATETPALFFMNMQNIYAQAPRLNSPPQTSLNPSLLFTTISAWITYPIPNNSNIQQGNNNYANTNIQKPAYSNHPPIDRNGSHEVQQAPKRLCKRYTPNKTVQPSIPQNKTLPTTSLPTKKQNTAADPEISRPAPEFADYVDTKKTGKNYKTLLPAHPGGAQISIALPVHTIRGTEILYGILAGGDRPTNLCHSVFPRPTTPNKLNASGVGKTVWNTQKCGTGSIRTGKHVTNITSEVFVFNNDGRDQPIDGSGPSTPICNSTNRRSSSLIVSSE